MFGAGFDGFAGASAGFESVGVGFAWLKGLNIAVGSNRVLLGTRRWRQVASNGRGVDCMRVRLTVVRARRGRNRGVGETNAIAGGGCGCGARQKIMRKRK